MRVLRLLLYAGAALSLAVAVPEGGRSPISSRLDEYTAPLRNVGARLTTRIGDGVDAITGVDELEAENENLRRQLAALGATLRDYEQTKLRVSELEACTGIILDSEKLRLSVPAEIISFIPNSPQRSFFLDIGSDDGVYEYAPLLSGDGLVGFAKNVSKSSCMAQTLYSSEVSVCIYSPMSGARGAVRGCELNCATGSFEVGETLYTSGDGGVFPAGIAVGVVFADGAKQYVEPLAGYSADSVYYAAF